MNPVRIQLQFPFPSEDASRPRRRWETFDFAVNPFPDSGVATGVDYNEHQVEEIRRINGWLGEIAQGEKKQYTPLIIKGTIGVGKTHVLRRIERELENAGTQVFPGKIGVSYHTATGVGAKNLLFSRLLQEALMAPLPGRENLEVGAGVDLPLLQEIFDALRGVVGGDRVSAAMGEIPRTSPIRMSLGRLLNAGGELRTDLERDFASWLMRRDLTRTALGRLGLSGRMEGEGEAVRAYAHVFRFARHVLNFRAWIMLIDQIEDLWRSSEVTPTKRARFLTDLRTLIDEGLEGAPVAPVLAWNTEVRVAGKVSQTHVEERVESEYRALYSRLKQQVDLPMLPIQGHAYPFAQRYVEAGNGSQKEQMLSALQRDLDGILERVPVKADGRVGDRVNQRAWLAALHGWADEVATESTPPPPARRKLFRKTRAV